MVTPNGLIADVQQNALHAHEPRCAQYPATPSYDSNMHTLLLFPALEPTGASLDSALMHNQSLCGQLTSRDLDAHNLLPNFDSDTFVPDRLEDYFVPSMDMTHGNHMDISGTTGQFLDLSSHCSNDDIFAFSAPAVSSPDGSASAPSPTSDMFSTRLSPGYMQHDLPNTFDIPRPHSTDAGYAQPPPYPGQYGQRLYTDSWYPDGLQLPRSQSFPHLPMIYRPLENWGTLPMPSVPSISQTGRGGISQLQPRPQIPLFSAFGRYPTTEELCRWPHLFSRGAKIAPKKQTLACHFCRDRKIGCTRPDEDDPDQTCNQCARRKRVCEYPTESRRGQHTRRRRTAKKSNVPALVLPSLSTF